MKHWSQAGRAECQQGEPQDGCAGRAEGENQGEAVLCRQAANQHQGVTIDMGIEQGDRQG